MKPLCSIFFHNYYGAHQAWMDTFIRESSFTANLYYNIASSSMYNLESAEKAAFYDYQSGLNSNIQKIIVRESPNKGKDIGGKLVLLDAYQKLDFQTEYGLFLHDKKSPYKANNQTWAGNLLKIADPAFSGKALQLLADKTDTGIVTAEGNIRDEYDYNTNSFNSNNKALLPELLDLFNIKPQSFQYVTGTMFWFRMKPVNDFFNTHPPLKIREMLEKGNISDEHAATYTHCWERLLSWLITAQNYKIKSI